MSMCRCAKCENLIDSDYDPECFVEYGELGDDRFKEVVELCETCREKYVDENGKFWPQEIKQ